MNGFWRGAFKGLFRGNPRQPALLRKLFVGRKIQPHQQANLPIHGGFGLRLGGFARFAGCFSPFSRGFCRGFRLSLGLFHRTGFFGDGRFCCRLRSRLFLPVHFVLNALVQAKSLPPTFQFVPRLLRFFLVGAEIKAHINTVVASHTPSLRRAAPPSQDSTPFAYSFKRSSVEDFSSLQPPNDFGV